MWLNVILRKQWQFLSVINGFKRIRFPVCTSFSNEHTTGKFYIVLLCLTTVENCVTKIRNVTAGFTLYPKKNCESFITPNDFTIHEKRVSRVEINPKISWEPKQKNALRGCLVGFSAKLLWSQYRLGDLIFKVICDVCYWRRANDIRWIEIGGDLLLLNTIFQNCEIIWGQRNDNFPCGDACVHKSKQ